MIAIIKPEARELQIVCSKHLAAKVGARFHSVVVRVSRALANSKKKNWTLIRWKDGTITFVTKPNKDFWLERYTFNERQIVMEFLPNENQPVRFITLE